MYKASNSLNAKIILATLLLLGVLLLPMTVRASAGSGLKLRAATGDSQLVNVKSSECADPFCHELRISFELEQPAFVDIRITTPMGAIVRQLASRELESGRHIFLWDGNDDNGQSVGSGVYIYTIQTLEEKKTDFLALLN
jgi:flagellar hook assembly protein FlgD